MKMRPLTFKYATEMDEPRNSERFHAAAQKAFGYPKYVIKGVRRDEPTPETTDKK